MNDKAEMSFITAIDHENDYPIGRVEEVLRFIDSKYVKDVPSDSLMDIAMNAVVRSLDPHSYYISPSEIEALNESIDGNFKGIGIESLFLNDTVNIVRVTPDGPADKAGLQQFDQIVAIGDSSVAGQNMNFDAIRELLKGGKGSHKTNVTIKKYDTKELVKLSIPLEKINLNSAQIFATLNDSTGIIKLTQFTETTYQDYMSAVEYLYDSANVRNLIIDVRDNPGGLLPQVTKILNQIIQEKGNILVYTEGQHSNKVEYKTNGKVFFPLDKIAILINENSASASEILAGAIQDWDRGVIVGRRSFGKGLVQERYPLSNGGAINLTVAEYYTPSGRSIQKDYSSKSNYNYDLQERLNSGMLTIKDTLEGNSTFTTKILQRKIYSNYGVQPDIFVPASPDEFDEKLNHHLSKCYEFAYQTLRKSSKSNNTSYILQDNIIDSFIDYIKEDGSNLDLNLLTPKVGEKIKECLTYSFTSIKQGHKEAVINSYKNDDFVREALLYLNNNKSLLDIKH